MGGRGFASIYPTISNPLSKFSGKANSFKTVGTFVALMCDSGGLSFQKPHPSSSTLAPLTRPIQKRQKHEQVEARHRREVGVGGRKALPGDPLWKAASQGLLERELRDNRPIHNDQGAQIAERFCNNAKKFFA